MTVAGERSKRFGAEGSYRLTSNGQTYTNVESDLFFTLIDEHRDLVESPAESDDERLQALLAGYVDGYNRYLDQTPEDERPEACRGEDWVRPIADAVLAYSQSPHDDSPHHVDQRCLYSQGEWVGLPFAEEAIEQETIGSLQLGG